MTIFYIPITDDNSDELDHLLESLAPFVNFATRPVVEVTTSDTTIEPLLQRLADHVRYAMPKVEPANGNGHKPEPEPTPEPVQELVCPSCGQPSKTGKTCRSCAIRAAKAAKKAAREKAQEPEPEPEEPAPRGPTGILEDRGVQHMIAKYGAIRGRKL